MSEIKPGDLVMVAKCTHCCGNSENLGQTFTVLPPTDRKSFVACVYCGKFKINDDTFVCLEPNTYCNRDRLIKIDPPADMKDTETEKELTV